MKYILTFIFLILHANYSFAIVTSRSTPTDSRIRVMVYNPNDVFKYVGYYNYHATIELGKDEEIKTVSMGDTTAWQIVPSHNQIFIKPIEHDATTNMTLITNKRTYLFELYAEEAADIRDPNMAFYLRFIYPDEEDEDHIIVAASNNNSAPDLTHPEKYNFNYTISGNEDIAPIKIYDDGEFTYLQFRDKNAQLPAIFAVDEERRESMVNYRLAKENTNIVILEQVFRKLSIRSGKKIVCIFNEAFKPY